MQAKNKPKQSAAGPAKKAVGPAERVVLRTDFYRDAYRRLVLIAICAVVLAIVEAGVIGILVTKPIQTKYFATENGRITPLRPLNEPYLSSRQVLQFAQEASVAAYTFDFVNYRKQLTQISEYFTKDGYSEYIDALSRSNLDIVTQKKYIVSAVASGAPVLTREGVRKGVYVWEVQLPMSVTYQSSSERADQKFIVKLLLARMPTSENPNGIGVNQIILDESL